LEPVVTYTDPCAPKAGVSEPPPSSTPGIERKPLPGVSEGLDKLPPQNIPNNLRQRVAPPPSGGLDRVASRDGRLQGTIVADDRITPRAGTRLVFTSAGKQGQQYSAQTDMTGRFAIDLPAGEWDIYMNDRDGKSVFHSQINVKNNDRRLVTVVSR
jgi:hypothetical protein